MAGGAVDAGVDASANAGAGCNQFVVAIAASPAKYYSQQQDGANSRQLKRPLVLSADVNASLLLLLLLLLRPGSGSASMLQGIEREREKSRKWKRRKTTR